MVWSHTVWGKTSNICSMPITHLQKIITRILKSHGTSRKIALFVWKAIHGGCDLMSSSLQYKVAKHSRMIKHRGDLSPKLINYLCTQSTIPGIAINNRTSGKAFFQAKKQIVCTAITYVSTCLPRSRSKYYLIFQLTIAMWNLFISFWKIPDSNAYYTNGWWPT